MSKQKTENLVKSILTKDSQGASSALKSIIDDKYQSALEAKKISIASKMYSKNT